MNSPITRRSKRGRPPKGSRPPTPPDQLMKVKEVAHVLGYHPKTIYRWIEKGKMPAIEHGRSWRVRRCDVQIFTLPT